MWMRTPLSWAPVSRRTRVRYLSCSPCRSVGYSTAQACQQSLQQSQASVLAETLRKDKHDCWGWIVYRTCYQDDHEWQHLKCYLQDNSERALARSDVPALKKSLRWTFIEDQAQFENASLDSLRSYFRERTKATYKREQPRAHGFVEAPRYMYFLKVVKHTTDNPDLTTAYGLSHIKLVKADAEPLVIHETHDDDEAAYEAIDGCSDFDVGWMKIALNLTGPNCYESLYGSNEAWYAYYQRPPDELLSC
ncbi:hypothetical protein BDZ85DRAFT_261337 [Elsinoe ampelina]|uniref:Uncharacterized protein n=1 Tax=Elsinoe ampelina TaxID=302913 RepID=A0A6A6GCE2_9PEZI|nr:hypothetical protein BDZ85DRAFT_261337 [Elsinoe ampelina]